MSHIVTIQTQIRDPVAVTAACQRLGLPPPTSGTFKLFTKTEKGLAVQLPGWNYPVVCDLENGSLKFDNYEGRWGDPQQLDRFLQCYAVEKARLEAHKHGYTVTEQLLSDGSIKLSVLVEG
jgi:hypothetical protein